MAKQTKTIDSSVFNNIKKLSNISNTLMTGINNNGSITRADEQDKIARNVEDVVNNESSDIVRNKARDYDEFMRKTNKKKSQRMNNGTSDEELDAQTVAEMFDSDADSIFTAFKDLYRKRNNLYDDLESIVERIFDLKEALNTTRDSIVSADELNKTISREITFDNAESLTNESGLKIVENMEEKYKLLQKIKNNIVPYTLLYGVYYTYQVPHSHIFEDYQRRKQNMNYRNSLTESAGFSDESLLESAALDIERETDISKDDAKVILTELSSQFTVINDPSCILESANTDYIQYKLDKGHEKSFTDKLKETRKMSKNSTVDGTSEVEDFKDVRDCYFELLDPRKILPIRVMDETIGYYYMRNDPTTTTTTNRFGEQLRKVNKGKGLGGTTDEQSLKNSVLGKMVDSIVQSFDKKFLEDNKEFKELILSSLMYDDNYNKSITFQFIPADFITEHKVNDGKSMLEPALFYGKLYMSLLIYNMFAIIGRSADQKIYWVRNSGADKNLANQVQSVARSIKKNRLNFNDLMNFNSIVGRVGINRELFIPVGSSNERGLDFDIMQGQDVNIHDEFMDGLLRKAVNATGVPSVIMNYINEADYAKTLVMANAKHLERCVSYQNDFNESITEMYRSLLLYSTDMDIDVIETLKFKFSVPSGLNSMNYADLINNVDQIANFVVETTLGRNRQPTAVDDVTKDIMYSKVARKYLPLDWDLMDSMFEDSRIEAEAIMGERKLQEDEE